MNKKNIEVIKSVVKSFKQHKIQYQIFRIDKDTDDYDEVSVKSISKDDLEISIYVDSDHIIGDISFEEDEISISFHDTQSTCERIVIEDTDKLLNAYVPMVIDSYLMVKKGIEIINSLKSKNLPQKYKIQYLTT